ncbi:MAG: hypothetical protein D6732_09085 [Methanobacteriota archaeon]|nr:MAG: hypothetical protein D6732_09085 [Euryarchaeota archaeon]
MKKLQYLPINIILLMVVIWVLLGAQWQNTEQSSQQGCDGYNCHRYVHGTIRWELKENLQVRIYSRLSYQRLFLGAEMYDANGRLVDMVEKDMDGSLILRAPEPGKYKIMVGYKYGVPLWDSLKVTVPFSKMGIPTTRYGSGTFQFFKPHPQITERAVWFRFAIPEKSHIELVIYNKSGKKLGTVVNKIYPEGLHGVYWEARDELGRLLPEGSYLCELRSDSRKVVQTVVVQR